MRNHRPRFFIFILLTLCLLQATFAWAQENPRVTPKNRKAVVPITRTTPEDMKLIAVEKLLSITPDGLLILSNGKKVKLDNIRIPQSANSAAKIVIEEALKDTDIGIYVSPEAAPEQYIDDTGFTAAHLLTSKGVWLQSVLVSRGMAWAEATNTRTRLFQTLASYEEQARIAQLGFWKMPEFAIKNESNIHSSVGSYQIYDGIIDNITGSKKFYFMRFSKAPQGLSLILNEEMSSEISIDINDKLTNLKGATVRIHGWVEEHNGPAIVIKSSDQIIIQKMPLTRATLQKTRKENKEKK